MTLTLLEICDTPAAPYSLAPSNTLRRNSRGLCWVMLAVMVRSAAGQMQSRCELPEAARHDRGEEEAERWDGLS